MSTILTNVNFPSVYEQFFPFEIGGNMKRPFKQQIINYY